MKTRSWTRVLSLLLTVAMIATLLVVPAVAAKTEETKTYTFSAKTEYTQAADDATAAKIGTDDYFNISTGKVTAVANVDD